MNDVMPETLHIYNGDKVRPTFSQEEMTRRINNLRQYMVHNTIDAVVLTSYHNINYFSDFVYCRFGRDYGAVITAEALTSVSANIDGGQPYRRNQLGDNLVYTDWKKDNFFRAVKKLLPKNTRSIGVEYDHVSLQTMQKFKDMFPDAHYVDIADATMKQRMKKSLEEISLIRQGARIADIGGKAVRDAIGIGVPEYEVALAGTQAMVRAIAAEFPHSELMDTWVWFQSGINTDGAHNPVTSRKIERGDILSLNTFPMISGYYTALERTLFAGEVSEASLKIWEANIDAYRKGLAMIKPGMRCCDIAHELNEVFRSHDLLQYRTFGYGHSFGSLCHYYGREAGLELREDIETVLEPGMVVSIEPMLMIPEGNPGAGGYREHDILVVGETSAENITHFPVGPECNVVRC